MELMRNGRKRVVISGLGVVSPLGQKQEFWDNIEAGKSGIRKLQNIEADHLNVRIGAEVLGFDSSKYIPPKQARRMGRATQFAIAAAFMAVEDAGLTVDGVSENGHRVATIIGTTLGSYEVGESGIRDWRDSGYKRANPMSIVNALPNMPGHYVSKVMNAVGPLITPSVACATGIQAVGEASDLIRLGKCDMVIAGAVDAVIFDYILAGFSATRALTRQYNDAPEQASRPFDADRSGFVLGEGGAVFIVESLEQARQRDAKIYAEVLGYAASSDAYHVAAPDPAGGGAKRAMQWTLDDARVHPSEVEYINAHGSSTVANDAIETAAVKHVFGEDAYGIPVTSTKSMIGHAMAGCGSLEISACLMTLEREVLHPTVNYDTPDPACDLDYVPNVARHVPGIRTVMSNSFGLGGQNASILLRGI
ncbi:MAG: beta-ketoacyl-[acyl-carrier-protein] synthase family protein [Chloroflexota bacterium]|nr:beta-ketoacyl-[acyl-carrier-protein] synthase family protein [Chloroflexota bacterium]MDE2946304.1 beta-ketoacyl-[acyl-carrier-protein] synthase family protein [Chloroflexota bacterium]